jgi:hypothetical protein
LDVCGPHERAHSPFQASRKCPASLIPLPFASSPLAAVARHSRHRTPSRLPELALPATVARRQPLHHTTSTASPSHTRCSLWHVMVSPHAGEIARRSLASALRRALLRGTRPSAPPFASLLHASAPHRLTEPVSPSPRPSSAGDGSPSGSSSVAPPLVMASLFRSSFGLTACTNVTALAQWSRWW